MDGFKALEKWTRKHYLAKIEFNRGVYPGDGHRITNKLNILRKIWN